MARTPKSPKQVASLEHEKATRKNIPTGELQSFAEMQEEQFPVATLRLTPEMLKQLTEDGKLEIGDAQLTWRGKDTQDWSDLVVAAPPLYIQEKIHPKAIIDALRKQTQGADAQADLFGQFNGLDPELETEFYQHDKHWSNRMILGDSLQVMASLAERESLRGKVQCIYFDPPYGIKFNSNWQVSTRSRDVKDGKLDQITREPEQVKAFRDTWKDGIHSYLTYLRDRLTAMRDLLTDSGSIFVQIGDENVHRVRALMDEVFGEANFVSEIVFLKTSSSSSNELSGVFDIILWYRRGEMMKYRPLFQIKKPGEEGATQYGFGEATDGKRDSIANWITRNHNIDELKVFAHGDLTSQRPVQGTDLREFGYEGREFVVKKGTFKSDFQGLSRAASAKRMIWIGNTLRYVRYLDDFSIYPHSNLWTDTITSGFSDPKVYVVQTNRAVAERCILMATDPGDLVLDPTCGSGTTATVAEQWGRRWITIDTSRVALALARARLMGAKYPYYKLADSHEGREQEQKVTGKVQPDTPTHGDIRQGFVYERAPHITLKSIANNAEIDVIWEKAQKVLEPLREQLNAARGRTTAAPGEDPGPPSTQGDPASSAGQLDLAWEEWQIPRHPEDPWSENAAKEHAKAADESKSEKVRAKALATLNELLSRTYTLDTLPERPGDPWNDPKAEAIHADWWEARIQRQKDIDASIAQKADVEMLYDRPYEDKAKVRVAGPFTVESLSPHRVVSAADEEIFGVEPDAPGQDFATMVLENLKSSGVQQASKEERIEFSSIEGWPGSYIGAVGTYADGETTRKAGIFIGPEFGSVTRNQLTAAAREASEARLDIVVACGFNFDAHASTLDKLGPIPILKAKMNPDLHMADDLKNTGSGNMFIVFGEPDIEWNFDEEGQIVVEVLGIDVFDPSKGEVRASGKDDIAAWFIDTDYDESSFFVRHAYFMGANDPYSSLKIAPKAEIDKDAWETLYSDTSRPFPRPENGRFAVKVINHFGDEVMKVFGV